MKFYANALNFPLNDISLIEASAGTGKTYFITILYIRLLLNLDNTFTFQKALTVQEILVLTFTRSMTQTLRDKIKDNIRQFKFDCIRGYSNHYLFSKLLLKIRNFDQAIIQLSEAEKTINQSSIFTIHSFCQNILMKNTIELNTLFNISITDNDIPLYQQICSDFWRRYFYSLPENIINFILECWKDPHDLLQDIFPFLYGEIPEIFYLDQNAKNSNFVSYYNQIILYIDFIKRKWNDNNHDLIKIIYTHTINRKVYNIKNLTLWIKQINQWTKKPTTDHYIPVILKYFKSSRLKINYNNSINHGNICSIFCFIEKLYQRLLSCKTLILNTAIHDIRKNLKKIKFSQSEITCSDLVDLLQHHLSADKTNKLAKIIRKYYPIAIIDEFQDIDQQQYKIFCTLYEKHKNNGLILIGDPKQSIYTFRGADIFSYMQTSRKINCQYHLTINWRSSPNMVHAVNTLFQHTSDPFIFKDIEFIPNTVADRNNKYQLIINQKKKSAMCFWLWSDKIITIQKYKKIMAQKCAKTINNLLYAIHHKKAWIKNEHHVKNLQASDITILVRDHIEADLIHTTLSQYNISTVFLSNQKNIFETNEAYELLLLLKAIISLEHKEICIALTTIFFKINASKIEKISHDISQWEKIIVEFSEYSLIWKKKGIYSMICKIIFQYQIPKKLLSIQQKEKNLINILHLAELLQNKSTELYNELTLIQWLSFKITSFKNKYQSNQLLRYNHNHQLIKISTIHKSKGLEFPLTFLPFISSFNYTNLPYFHNRQSFKKILDINKLPFHKKLSNEEKLSEDIRLLYVALTRSIYHCSIGIAPIIYKKIKTLPKKSDFHHSALGFLIQKKIAGDIEYLQQNLKILNIKSNGDIVICPVKPISKILTIPRKNDNKFLSVKKWDNSLINNKLWTITSYTALTHKDVSILANFYHESLDLEKNHKTNTPHTLPKGKVFGIFLHYVLAKVDFQKTIDIHWLHNQLEKYNFSTDWTNIIQKWIHIIINTPLNKKNCLILSKILPEHKLIELKFCFPINTYLTDQKLDSLCKNYDLLSYKSYPLNFKKIKGMLQGFIDLVFKWNNQYYILDYKTNWMGSDDNAYNYSKIEQEMIKNNYALQYQLYTLALHRFLKHRIVSYDYEKNFGGIYYLFVRGMNNIQSKNGIFFHRPSLIFINALDNLFSHI